MTNKKPTIAPYADPETAFMEQALRDLESYDDMTDEEAIERMRDPEFIAELAEACKAISPDPIGCDRFFLSGFITEEMAMEFPIIAHDFLSHVYKDIPSFWQDIYGVDRPKDGYSFSFLNQKILNMMYLAAKGNGVSDGEMSETQTYAISLFRNLYRSYHRKEYLALKRHTSLTVADVFSIAVLYAPSYSEFIANALDDADAVAFREEMVRQGHERTDGIYQLASYARILVMSGFLGITLKPECKYVYKILMDECQKLDEADISADKIFTDTIGEEDENAGLTAYERKMKKEAKKLGITNLPEGYSIPEKFMEESRSQVQEWLADSSKTAGKNSFGYVNPLDSEMMLPYVNADSFIGDVLNYYGYSQDYIIRSNYHHKGLERELIRTLALLKWRQPGREHSFAEVQVYSLLMCGAGALVGQMDRADEYLDCMFGIDDRYYEWDDSRRKFKPGSVAKPVSEDKVHTAPAFESAENKAGREKKDKKDADLAEKRLTEEVNRLREKTHSQENKIRMLYSMYSEARDKAEEYREIQESYDSDRKELQALREHVYKYTEDVQGNDDGVSDIESMEKAIAQKKIVIIGGMDSWTNRLKARFSNWRFISTDLSAMADLRIFDGADYTYFFTDYLSHDTYAGYVRVLRVRGLPFGYIHSVNTEKNIRQIFEDTCI